MSGVGGSGRVEVIVNLVLPVELTSFRAAPVSSDIELTWQTATEINSDHYSIEHSQTGTNWTELGRINAYGTTAQPQDYRYIHVQPAPGVHYYRLRMVDLDDTYEYSPTVAATIEDGLTTEPRAWRAEGNIYVQGISNAAGGQLSLYGPDGRLVQSRSVLAGDNTPGLPVGDLHQQMHILVWQPLGGDPVSVKVY